jgi:hypothetical protein
MEHSSRTLEFLGDLLRNTKFNAETAETAEKNPYTALRALRSNVVISFHGVCPAHDDSVASVVDVEPTQE